MPTQETPVSWLVHDPAGLGLGFTVHFEPFQLSVSVEPSADPTAMQLVAPGQLIAVSELKPGFGAVINDQPAPFHRSMNEPEVLGLCEPPTAKQALSDAHETPPNALPVTPGGLALRTIFQAGGVVACADAT